MLPSCSWSNWLSRHEVTIPRLWAAQPIYCDVSASDGNLYNGTMEDGTRLMAHAPENEWISLERHEESFHGAAVCVRAGWLIGRPASYS